MVQNHSTKDPIIQFNLILCVIAKFELENLTFGEIPTFGLFGIRPGRSPKRVQDLRS